MFETTNHFGTLPEPFAARSADSGAHEATVSGPREQWFGASELKDWTGRVAPPVPLRVRRQSLLVAEGAAARYLYIVQAGDFKVSRVGEDGYEQVLGFATASDALGLDGLAHGAFLGSAEALQDSMVYAVPMSDLRALRASNPTFDARLQEALSSQWLRMCDMAWLMAALGADRRIARFLLQQSRNMGERGLSTRKLRLPMSRRDIAAYLGLAHESVSRSFTALASAGYLHVRLREVEIVDIDALQQLASCTRGHLNDGAPASPSDAPRVAAAQPLRPQLQAA